ncbi:MAG: hypothetical protein DI606_15615 [Sphingobium sp.]|nr:MAG: hypothetical protein DI606_15615 [Sphingobium sp.]
MTTGAMLETMMRPRLRRSMRSPSILIPPSVSVTSPFEMLSRIREILSALIVAISPSCCEV